MGSHLCSIASGVATHIHVTGAPSVWGCEGCRLKDDNKKSKE